ncbi:NAD(P)H:quinone oxidoreductase [Paraburkholderia sp. LEh10]|uniref:NAD(P)H:quinone oxidoreductase n=1 Tax=Paraburkholderia sp. LEh10 TaxID=2821353 RepID=UPI001AE11AA8|nr:NAD(P)H:quinone oxidoreductase [Paraburkholderia sp. LEh10]MBP0590420.1 NAD(P)H:quinone oxidoreductase [Paraburkholderia sp. LEh10]
MSKIAIIYYSSTGNTYHVAKAAAEGAQSTGAEVRLLRAAELVPDSVIDKVPNWRAHIDATKDVPVATPDDLVWADGFLFGTPTRFGLPAAQLKQFIDGCSGPWSQGKLQDKATGVFGGAGNVHGGQEATLLALQNVFYHWGSVIVPIGYTDPAVYAAGGNPYGVSFTDPRGDALPDGVLDAARHLGRRTAKIAELLRSYREAASA